MLGRGCVRRADVGRDLKTDSTGTHLARELRRPHPVGRALDVSECGDRCPHKIRQGLCHGESGHCRRRQQALDRLLAHGSCNSGGRRAIGRRQVRLCNNSHIRERRVQRADALLLRDEATNRPVNLRQRAASQRRGACETKAIPKSRRARRHEPWWSKIAWNPHSASAKRDPGIRSQSQMLRPCQA